MPAKRFLKHSFSAKIVRLGILYSVEVPASVSRAIGVRGHVPVLARQERNVDRGLPRSVPFRHAWRPHGLSPDGLFNDDRARRHDHGGGG